MQEGEISLKESLKSNSDCRRTSEAAVLHTFFINVMSSVFLPDFRILYSQSSLLTDCILVNSLLQLFAIPTSVLTVPSQSLLGTWKWKNLSHPLHRFPAGVKQGDAPPSCSGLVCTQVSASQSIEYCALCTFVLSVGDFALWKCPPRIMWKSCLVFQRTRGCGMPYLR